MRLLTAQVHPCWPELKHDPLHGVGPLSEGQPSETQVVSSCCDIHCGAEDVCQGAVGQTATGECTVHPNGRKEGFIMILNKH